MKKMKGYGTKTRLQVLAKQVDFMKACIQVLAKTFF
jgi:hypothetical protein